MDPSGNSRNFVEKFKIIEENYYVSQKKKNTNTIFRRQLNYSG